MPGDIKVATDQNPDLPRIQSLVSRRNQTDRRMGYAWMIIPLLPPIGTITTAAIFLGILISLLPKMNSLSQPNTAQSAIEPIAGGFLALLGLGVIVLFAVSLLGALSFYYLIERRNQHFGRQQLLFSTIHRYLASKRPASEGIAKLGYLAEDSVQAETPRPAGLWAFASLFAIPIVGLIASYNLTHDMRKHDEFQSEYQAALATSLVESGFQEPNFSSYKFHNRDSVLFLILTAITGGLFWIYWYYTLLKDYNDHFIEQAAFEDQILRTLIPASTHGTCRTCGGAVPPTAKFCPSCGTRQLS